MGFEIVLIQIRVPPRKSAANISLRSSRSLRERVLILWAFLGVLCVFAVPHFLWRSFSDERTWGGPPGGRAIEPIFGRNETAL